MTAHDLLACAFSDAPHLDRAELRRLFGGKGAALVGLVRAGLPVPPGFTFTTAAFHRHRRSGWDDALERELLSRVDELERASGRRLGDGADPLLVSVRSGAAVSMPGMMDTVLNVGMTPSVEAALAERSGDAAFAADTARRSASSYREIVGTEPPAGPVDQIRAAVAAVFASWDGDRARAYREVEGIDDDLGTAVTVQAMVFGNRNERSGTGVAFSRDPVTGERTLSGDFLVGAQGEDVVAGGAASRPLDEMAARWPELHARLAEVADELEREYGDLVDVEFTVEDGRLWVLQARVGTRSPVAGLRMAIDMAEDPDFPLDRAAAVERCRRWLDDPPTAPAAAASVVSEVATGLAASPGLGTGELCLAAERAVIWHAEGRPVVLARPETSPADVRGMSVARGLFTTRGGLVSHAAVVARDWGIPAVVGADDAIVEEAGVRGPGGFVAEGTTVTVDGDRGLLLRGAASGRREVVPEVRVLRSWADELAGVDEDSGLHPGAGGATSDDGIDEWDVLHTLVVKGMVDEPGLASALVVAPGSVAPVLDQLAQAGHAEPVGARDLWRPTDAGRSLAIDRLTALRERVGVAALAYDQFLVLDGELKAVCTDWQVRGGEPNDHTDAAHDDAVRARHAELHGRVDAYVASLEAHLPWTSRYRARLGDAARRVAAGDAKALTGVMCESYHDVWMELHEDLLLVTGTERGADGSH